MATDNEEHLAKILATNEGQQVIMIFIDTWHNTGGDFKESFERAKQVGQANGSWVLIEISAWRTFLKAFSLTIETIQIWLSKQGKKDK
jgi:hypothetical protein